MIAKPSIVKFRASCRAQSSLRIVTEREGTEFQLGTETGVAGLQSSVWPHEVQMWSRNTPEPGPTEPFKLHQVDLENRL